LKKLKLLLIFCSFMSLQCYAVTFSKMGTVWALDCNEGSLVRSFAKTSGGDLGFFSWHSPGVRNNFSLIRFYEEGDQITYMVKNLDNNDVFITRVSFAGGVWSILYSKKNDVALIHNGLFLDSGKKAPSFNQCSQNSTAYRMVFPNQNTTTQRNNTNRASDLMAAKYFWEMSVDFGGVCEGECADMARKYPAEYSKFVAEYKNQRARENSRMARAKQECRNAGDIDRCIRITMGKE
jgi:hypothetical protein